MADPGNDHVDVPQEPEPRTLLFSTIALFFRVLLHGFGAVIRSVWSDRYIREFIIGILLILVLFSHPVRGFWMVGTAVESYDLTDEDFASCPPGNRLKKDTWSKLSLTGPHCEPVTTQDNVTFGEDLETLLTRLAPKRNFTSSWSSQVQGLVCVVEDVP